MMHTLLRHLPIAAVAALLGCSAGGGAAPAGPATAPVSAAPAVRVPPAVEPTFSATVTGNGWVDGTVGGGARYFRETGGTTNQPFDLRGSELGDEKDKACGKDWRPSEARSIVTVTPQIDPAQRTAGFTLIADATSARGRWREKGVLTCTTVSRSDAQSASMARGLIAVTLGGPVGGRDRLFIDTTGFSIGEWAFRVSDTGGTPLATERLGTGLVAEVPGPGSYEVVASVTARAAAATRDSIAQRLRASVRIASLRNSIAAATGRYPTPDMLVPFDAVLPTPEISGLIQRSLATYQPCGTKPGCAGKVFDASVRAVWVRSLGGGVAIDLVFAGTKRAPINIRLIGEPEVRGDSLYLTSAHLDPAQRDVAGKRDLADASARLAGRIAATGYPIAGPLREGEQAVRSRFPVSWGAVCVGAADAPPAFMGLRPVADSTALAVVFAIAPEPARPCPRPR
jgi:hypothetical protein